MISLSGNTRNTSKRPEKPKKKALRVGIIQRGKLVDERWFRKATAITVGSAGNNTFCVEDAGVPQRYPLFASTKEGLSLQVPEGMAGKLIVGGRHLSLLQVESFGKEVGRFTTRAYRAAPGQERTVFSVPLDDNTRGRIQLGETTLLFQFADPPPAPVAASAPKLLAGGWHKGVDWAYASIIMLSFLAHSAGVYWLQQLGPLPNNAAASIGNLEKRIKMIEVPRIPKPRITPKKVVKKDPKKADKKANTRRKGPKRTRRPKRASNTRPPKRPAPVVSARDKARNIGILKLLTSKGKKGDVTDLMAKDGSDTMTKTLEKLKGVSTNVSNRFHTRRRKTTQPKHLNLRKALIGDDLNGTAKIRNGGQQQRQGADITKAANEIKLHIEKPEVNGSLDVKTIMKIIKRKYSLIKYCYEKELKKNGTLKGKVSVEAKINRMGRAYDLSIVSDTMNNGSVNRCLKSRIRSFRFPRPKDGEVTIELPFIFSQ